MVSHPAQMHENVGGFVARQGIDQLVACGPLGKSLAKGAREAGQDPAHIMEVSDAKAAADAVKAIAKSGDVVLIKASRGMKLERVVDALQGVKGARKKAS
jgi:UDP-N-acetylmuramoyl-tripeptide--D-alanyl-D-alanine ligase